ncbi:MAG: hypothetical protein K2G35_07055 [Duncaniella sp.]|nr:hypothetical protein [Duncaniella sp.]
MGDQRAYVRGKNDFYAYTYTSLSARITINGVTGRLVEKKIPFKTKHRDLPAYAGQSDVYFAKGADGLASQAKLYSNDRKMRLDFDWDHVHINKHDGRRFPIGTVHVQEYRVCRVKDPSTGKLYDRFTRVSKNARSMSLAEIEKYGPLIHYFNPHVKFK